MEKPLFFKRIPGKKANPETAVVSSYWDTMFEPETIYEAVQDEREKDGTIDLVLNILPNGVKESYWVNAECFEQVEQ